MRTALLFGLGNVGSWALEFLARAEGVDRIVACQRDAEAGIHRTHVAAVGAVFQEHAKKIEFRHADVNDRDGTARLLAEVRPDVILSSLTMQSPRVLITSNVPPEIRARLREATFSIWLPWHVLPVARLMEAVMRSGIDTSIVNIAFPDVVNVVLWRHFGTGPVLGAGNIEMVAATMARYVSESRAAPLGDVEVTIVASHAYLAPSARGHVPSFLRVLLRGEDVTADLDIDYLLDQWGGMPWARTALFSGFAASATKNVLALMSDVPQRTTVTAPNGLPGGYPAVVSRRGVTLALPPELDRAAAIAINEAGNRYDGIERITPDGTVVYTDTTYSIMREFDYDCRELRFDELADRARQLGDLFARISGIERAAAQA